MAGNEDQEKALNEYLASVDMAHLIKDMTKALLHDRPEIPVDHIIKHLYEVYPDNAKEAKVPMGGAKAMMPSSSLSGLLNQEVEYSSEEEDDVDAPEYIPPKNISKKGRKTAVSAESMDPNKMKEQMKNLTVIEKSPEVEERLKEVVGKSAMLKMLDDEQKRSIINAFAGPLEKKAGEDIIVQGDNGEVFYLLDDGAVDVYIKNKEKPDEEIKVHTYNPGDAFGELAIMYNAPRAATCRAQTDVKLWSLDRVSFKVIVVAAAMLKREMYEGFLEKVPILESLNPGERQTLADALAEEKYPDGASICTQGEEGNFFYIIKEGTAKCYVGDTEVAELTAGSYFGEIALMTSKPRQATVKASGELKVLALDRATFTRVLGNLGDIMKRNMAQYDAYIAKEV